MGDHEMTRDASSDFSSFPSLSLRLVNTRYAVTAKCVSSIVISDSKLVNLPEAPHYCKGLMHMRGQMIPIMDMRSLFGYKTMDQEHAEFCEMLDMRKQDHVNWVTEFERCIAAGESFGLATDPHKCKLGIWFDSFSSSYGNINIHLHKLSEPHESLHKLAKEYNELLSAGKLSEEKKQSLLKKAKEDYVPAVLDLLEQTKQVFNENIQSLVVVIENGHHTLGLIVDEVLAVDTLLTVTTAEDVRFMDSSRFISGIANEANSSETYLMLDHEAIFSICEDIF